MGRQNWNREWSPRQENRGCSYAEYAWRTSFERAGVGLVRHTMVEKDAIACANGGLTVPFGVPGETKARRRID